MQPYRIDYAGFEPPDQNIGNAIILYARNAEDALCQARVRLNVSDGKLHRSNADNGGWCQILSVAPWTDDEVLQRRIEQTLGYSSVVLTG